MNRFFGKKEQPTLEQTQATMNSRVDELTTKINDITQQIRYNLDMSNKTSGSESQRYKQKAVMLMKQKKQLEQHRNMTEQHQMNLQSMQIQVDQMKDYQQVYETMQASNRQMQQLANQFDLNRIEDIQDQMMNFAEDQIEIGEILSQDITAMDFGNLDDELAELGDEMFDGDMTLPETDGFSSVPNGNQQMYDQRKFDF